jgi:hypothetical protein
MINTFNYSRSYILKRRKYIGNSTKKKSILVTKIDFSLSYALIIMAKIHVPLCKWKFMNVCREFSLFLLLFFFTWRGQSLGKRRKNYRAMRIILGMQAPNISAKRVFRSSKVFVENWFNFATSISTNKPPWKWSSTLLFALGTPSCWSSWRTNPYN